MRQLDRNEILHHITNIENQLRYLRLAIEQEVTSEGTTQANTGPLRVGERVTIKNPKGSQPTEGILTKIHSTKRGTVTTTNAKGQEIKIVRLLSNLTRNIKS